MGNAPLRAVRCASPCRSCKEARRVPLSDEEGLDIVRSNARVAAWRLLTPFVVLALLAGALVAGRACAGGGSASPPSRPGRRRARRSP